MPAAPEILTPSETAPAEHRDVRKAVLRALKQKGMSFKELCSHVMGVLAGTIASMIGSVLAELRQYLRKSRNDRYSLTLSGRALRA